MIVDFKEAPGMKLQHQDINVGPGHYKHLDPDELLVTKIFFTLQGEGPYAGWPAIFLRLAGCNRGEKRTMGCGFCDTAFYFGKGQRMKFHQIIARFKQLLPVPDSYYPLIVITGGEPMMQDNLVSFIAELNIHEFFEIQIESNGDRLARNFLEASSSTGDVKLVISPKVSKEGYHPLRVDVHTRADVLKFLISADPDSPYHTVPDYAADFAFGLYGKPVYLSPMAVYNANHEPGQPVSAWADEPIDRQATRMNYIYAAKLAMASGFRLSMQQHLFLDLE